MVYVQSAAKSERDKMPTVDLSLMRAGQSGIIVRLNGGRGLMRKLENMGIRPGVSITKISSQIMRGPVIIRVGSAQVAIGYGMARRIIIALD
jgi:ferrous iron transport protein A